MPPQLRLAALQKELQAARWPMGQLSWRALEKQAGRLGEGVGGRPTVGAAAGQVSGALKNIKPKLTSPLTGEWSTKAIVSLVYKLSSLLRP